MSPLFVLLNQARPLIAKARLSGSQANLFKEMKPLFTKAIRDRSSTSKTRGYRGYGSNNHQMIPLSGTDDKGGPANFRDKVNKSTYSAHATSKFGGGDIDEHIIAKGRIEYEREFIVEEQYIGDSTVLPKPVKQAHN